MFIMNVPYWARGLLFWPHTLFNPCIFLFQIMALALSFQECSCEADPPPTVLAELRGCYSVAFAASFTDSPLAKIPHLSQSSNIIYLLHSLLEVFQKYWTKHCQTTKHPASHHMLLNF